MGYSSIRKTNRQSAKDWQELDSRSSQLVDNRVSSRGQLRAQDMVVNSPRNLALRQLQAAIQSPAEGGVVQGALSSTPVAQLTKWTYTSGDWVRGTSSSSDTDAFPLPHTLDGSFNEGDVYEQNTGELSRASLRQDVVTSEQGAVKSQSSSESESDAVEKDSPKVSAPSNTHANSDDVKQDDVQPPQNNLQINSSGVPSRSGSSQDSDETRIEMHDSTGGALERVDSQPIRRRQLSNKKQKENRKADKWYQKQQAQILEKNDGIHQRLGGWSTITGVATILGAMVAAFLGTFLNVTSIGWATFAAIVVGSLFALAPAVIKAFKKGRVVDTLLGAIDLGTTVIGSGMMNVPGSTFAQGRQAVDMNSTAPVNATIADVVEMANRREGGWSDQAKSWMIIGGALVMFLGLLCRIFVTFLRRTKEENHKKNIRDRQLPFNDDSEV